MAVQSQETPKGRWRMLYAAVLSMLALEIALFYLFTRAFA